MACALLGKWLRACCMCAVLSTGWPHGLTDDRLQDLQGFLGTFMECREIPGLTLAIVTADEVILQKGFGKANLESDVPVTSATRFCVASLTKAFTATVAGMLLKEKGYSWDTPVMDILGDCCEFPTDHMTKSVTVRDLLLHRTGLPRYDFLWISDTMDTADMFRRIKCMDPVEQFRDKGVYNNIMYALAGRVVAALSEGQSWSEAVMSRLLEPLGMTDTTFLWNTSQNDPTVATGYKRDTNGPVPVVNDNIRGANKIAPAIAMFSTGEDMTKWVQLQLNSGVSGTGEQVVPADIMSECHRPQASADSYINTVTPPTAPVSLTYDLYGLAWYSGFYRGNRSLMHYGSFPGYYSLITLLPDISLGIYSSINGGFQDNSFTINTVLHTYIMDLFLGHEPWLTPQSACKFGNTKVKYDLNFQIKEGQYDLTEFEGTYAHSVFGTIYIAVNSTNGNMYLHYGKIRCNLLSDESLDYGVFRAISTIAGNPFGIWGVVTFRFNKSSVSGVLVPFLAWKFDPEFSKLPVGGASERLQEILQTCEGSSANIITELSWSTYHYLLLILCIINF